MSFNSVYTQMWRVLLHLAADPYPDVSDLAMKVLNSIAYKVRLPPAGSGGASGLGQVCPRSDTAPHPRRVHGELLWGVPSAPAYHVRAQDPSLRSLSPAPWGLPLLLTSLSRDRSG